MLVTGACGGSSRSTAPPIATVESHRRDADVDSTGRAFARHGAPSRSTSSTVTTGATGTTVAPRSMAGSVASGTDKAAFVAKANAICQAATNQFAILSQSSDGFLRISDAIAAAAAQIQALPQPAGDKSQLAVFYSGNHLVDSNAHRYYAALLARNLQEASVLADQGLQLLHEVHAAATAYGLDACAEESAD
jgi:hypothetical protein